VNKFSLNLSVYWCFNGNKVTLASLYIRELKTVNFL
jgi:hypothetical protein